MILALAERLQAALCQPYRVGGTEVNSSASIGITLQHAWATQTPTRCCATPTSRCTVPRPSGRARHAVFDSALRTGLSEQVQLESDLRAALEHDQITLAYQPIYDLVDGRIVAFEALARWHASAARRDRAAACSCRWPRSAA